MVCICRARSGKAKLQVRQAQIENAETFTKEVIAGYTFSSNMRGSEVYRRHWQRCIRKEQWKKYWQKTVRREHNMAELKLVLNGKTVLEEIAPDMLLWTLYVHKGVIV